MKTQIREANTTDIKPLVALSRKTIADNYSSFLGDQEVKAYIESGAVDQYVADNIERCVVIVEDGTAIGFSVTKKNLIDLMMVDTDYHRRGLGTSLLQHVEDMLFQNYEDLTLESFKDNVKANAFYRKCGWVEVRTFTDDQSGKEKIELCKSRSHDSTTIAPG